MNQKQLAELFDTSKQNIGQHIANLLTESELAENPVVKNYFTTAADGEAYKVAFYALDMILAIGPKPKINCSMLSPGYSALTCAPQKPTPPLAPQPKKAHLASTTPSTPAGRFPLRESKRGVQQK